jgi:hypothetical protein
LWKTTEWLRLPLQPTTPNSAALLTFAHRPNSNCGYPDGTGRWVLACFRRQRPVLKVSNFDQTIVNNLPRSAKAKEKPAELSKRA